MPHLELHLLGTPQMLLDGSPIQKIRYERVKALLFYLATESAKPHRRGDVAVLLMPTDLYDPRKALRGVLRDMRSTLEETAKNPHFIFADRHNLQFNPQSDYFLDVQQFKKLITQTRLHQHASLRTCTVCQDHIAEAINYYQGDFLDGFYLGDAPLDDWIERTRQTLRHQMVTALQQRLESRSWNGDFETASQLAQRWLQMEPADENALRSVMRLLALRGNISQALTQLQQTKDRFVHLSGSLETKTEYLAEQIRTRKDSFRHNLPPQETPFVGRERDLELLCRYLGDSRKRIVVITGPGGQGKTRLAWQAAREKLGAFEDGVFWIPVGSLQSGEFLAQMVAQKFGILLSGSTPPEIQVRNALQERSLLLIFDGAESIKSTLETWISDLLLACSGLQILITSRENIELSSAALRIADSIPGKLSAKFPGTGFTWELAALPPQDGVQLFIERAVRVAPNFQVSNASAPPVAQIHHLLGGLSLALELSAVHIERASVAQVTQELEKRLQTLNEQPDPAALLWEILAWHTTSLSYKEKSLFQRLSVFVGGWNISAAQAVCSDSRLTQAEISAGLSSLERQVFIRIETKGEDARYSMLDEVRYFARQQLTHAGEESSLQERHLEYFIVLAEQAEPELRGGAQQTWLEILQTEQHNLRAALQAAIARSDGEKAGRLSGAIWQFWYMRGYLREGMDWFQAILGLKSQPPKKPRLKSLTGAGNLSLAMGQLDQAQAYYEQAFPLAEQLNDQRAQASLSSNLGSILFNRGQTAAALTYFKQSRAAFKVLGETLLAAKISINLGNTAQGLGDYETAQLAYEESLPVLDASNDQHTTGILLLNMGHLYSCLGQKEIARQHYEDSLHLRETMNDSLGIAHCCINLGDIARQGGDENTTWKYYRRGIKLCQQLENTYLLTTIFEGIAEMESQSGNLERSVQLMAAAVAFRDATDSDHPAEAQKKTTAIVDCLRTQLTPSAFEQAWSRGQTISIEQLVKEVLGEG